MPKHPEQPHVIHEVQRFPILCIVDPALHASSFVSGFFEPVTARSNMESRIPELGIFRSPCRALDGSGAAAYGPLCTNVVSELHWVTFWVDALC